jgi:acyl transferase domain-containing protein
MANMTKDKLIEWLKSRVAQSLYLSPEQIRIDEPLEHYGLGSKESVMISGDLEELLDRELSHTILWDFPTIEALSTYLIEEKVSKRMVSSFIHTDEPIAIIGIGCRFPGANSPEQFWQLLIEGKDQISVVPENRWTSFPEENAHIRYGGFLSQVDQFDPAFFGISPREAELMDPQQRMLLEVTWEAMENAGLRMEELRGTDTSVFMGISASEYVGLLEKENDFYYLTGNSFSIAANRISYFMDWYGPSMAIDTACSSSLVALDLACQSLRHNQSSLAFVGGANLLLRPSNSIRFAAGDILASDGRCKTFDASADGYVRGEGAGVVVLKPLSQAQADGNTVYAVIHGSSVNQDGKSNGLTAPNVHAQKALLQKTTKIAGVQPSDVFYVEAHGTGTALGDPIEVRALAEVYAQKRNNPLYLGSVKTNIGHLEAAAGVAGLIKATLSLYHKSIPPNLHFQQWNPQIPADRYDLEVVNKVTSIPKYSYLGVSSFGFGGTNAHVLLGEAPALPSGSKEVKKDHDYVLLPISAKNKKSLQRQVSQYKHYMEKNQSISLARIATNAWNKRDHHDERLVIVAKNKGEALDLLVSIEKNEQREQLHLSGEQRQNKVVFVCSGQGPKWSISKELFEKEPAFREAIVAIDKELPDDIPWSIIDKITNLKTETPLSIIETQILYFSVQVALAKLWISWGIRPSAIVGNSLGEVAAAFLAGALTISEALAVVIYRSQCAEKLVGKGKLLVIQTDRQVAEQLCKQVNYRVAIAVYNSPTSHVLSGETRILEDIKERLEEKGIFARFVASSDYPSHSFYMNEIRAELAEHLRFLQPKETSIPFVSTVTGTYLDGSMLDAKYWCDNICHPVQFRKAISQLILDNKNLFLEISPHPILETPLRECALAYQKEIQVLASLERDQPSYLKLLTSLAAMYCNGILFDWKSVMGENHSNVSLPTYAWNHQRYWMDASVKKETEETVYDSKVESNRSKKIDEYMIELIGSELKIPPEQIPLNKPIIHLGFDSIMAMRLKNRVEKDFAVQVSIVSILQGCTVEELIQSLSTKGG